VFKTVYPSTIAYLWLTNTTRITLLESHVKCAKTEPESPRREADD